MMRVSGDKRIASLIATKTDLVVQRTKRLLKCGRNDPSMSNLDSAVEEIRAMIRALPPPDPADNDDTILKEKVVCCACGHAYRIIFRTLAEFKNGLKRISSVHGTHATTAETVIDTTVNSP
jgi:hypothetical protein